MRIQFKHLLLASCASVTSAQHNQLPQEDNVFSPAFCVTNESGFGGVPILSRATPSENTYFYEMTFQGENPSDDDIDDALFEVEKRIADFLLATETEIFTVCARRRAKTADTAMLRKLQTEAEAVAITVNPRDFNHAELTCSTMEAASGSTCVVVEGFYQVYFAEGAVGVSSAMEDLNQSVKSGMDDDVFVGGDIDKVTWIDDLPNSAVDESNEAENPTVQPIDNSRGNSTPAIVGSSVGGILAIGLLAFYRRRNTKNTDDDTLTNPGGSTSA